MNSELDFDVICLVQAWWKKSCHVCSDGFEHFHFRHRYKYFFAFQNEQVNEQLFTGSEFSHLFHTTKCGNWKLMIVSTL